MTPSQRSLKLLRESGWVPWIVERWNQHARIRQDMYGFVDIVAIKPNKTLAVQTTSWSNISARKQKIIHSDLVLDVLGAGWEINIHGWRKNKKTGRWEVKCVDILKEMCHEI